MSVRSPGVRVLDMVSSETLESRDALELPDAELLRLRFVDEFELNLDVGLGASYASYRSLLSGICLPDLVVLEDCGGVADSIELTDLSGD
jgi:hypothetical protein